MVPPSPLSVRSKSMDQVALKYPNISKTSVTFALFAPTSAWAFHSFISLLFYQCLFSFSKLLWLLKHYPMLPFQFLLSVYSFFYLKNTTNKVNQNQPYSSSTYLDLQMSVWLSVVVPVPVQAHCTVYSPLVPLTQVSHVAGALDEMAGSEAPYPGSGTPHPRSSESEIILREDTPLPHHVHDCQFGCPIFPWLLRYLTSQLLFE